MMLGGRGRCAGMGFASAPSVGCLPLPRQPLCFHLFTRTEFYTLAIRASVQN